MLGSDLLQQLQVYRYIFLLYYIDRSLLSSCKASLQVFPLHHITFAIIIQQLITYETFQAVSAKIMLPKRPFSEVPMWAGYAHAEPGELFFCDNPSVMATPCHLPFITKGRQRKKGPLAGRRRKKAPLRGGEEKRLPCVKGAVFAYAKTEGLSFLFTRAISIWSKVHLSTIHREIFDSKLTGSSHRLALPKQDIPYHRRNPACRRWRSPASMSLPYHN